MKIVIAGYGVEGKSNYTYFRREFPDAEMVIADEQHLSSPPEGAISRSGIGVFERLDDADLVVRTAGLPPRNIKTNGKIWSATNEFFNKCPAPIIGVTGTKGKGTTCSLIASILRQAGKTVHLVGNIGVPALDILPKVSPSDIVVYELSSFQLWDLEKSPHIAVVLMIEPDHLDVHDDMDDYVEAKSNIARHQTSNDTVIFYAENQFSKRIADQSPGEKVTYPYNIDEKIKKALRLPGKHNYDNLTAAIAAVQAVVPEIDSETIARGVEKFRGLDHRLKLVREVGGVRYFDDSIATTPGSAIAAVKSFDAPKILLLGGKDKGGDYTELARLVARDPDMIYVVVYGENADRIMEFLTSANVDWQKIIQLQPGSTMLDIVNKANQLAQAGDVVILSPASASFDMFSSYSDRGEQFIEAVNHLAARGADDAAA